MRNKKKITLQWSIRYFALVLAHKFHSSALCRSVRIGVILCASYTMLFGYFYIKNVTGIIKEHNAVIIVFIYECFYRSN